MVRPSDLAVRVADAQYRDTFRLPIDAARRKAREVIDHRPQDGLTPTIENWRQLPDGQIEFAIRYFSTSDWTSSGHSCWVGQFGAAPKPSAGWSKSAFLSILTNPQSYWLAPMVRRAQPKLRGSWQPNKEVLTMDGRIMTSEGQYVVYIKANSIYDLDGKKPYDL
jgi:hypothetical protein